MTAYRRQRLPGGIYFFTIALADRRSTLLTDEIKSLRAAFRHTRRRHPFVIEAIVILPDHLHAIWRLPDDDADFSTRWRLIKSMFSRGLPSKEAISASRTRHGERGVWQRRYWEHTIRDDDDFASHVHYIHFNPVKHGHVAHPADWPFSSFRRMVQLGVYADETGLREADGGQFGER